MHLVTPTVFPIAETRTNGLGIESYLDHIGAAPEDWSSDDPGGAEELIEVMGRGCYKSFGTKLNPNITQVRASSKEYLRNIINIGHGSVLEHGTVSFMFCDVSRVFTHELVRHRAGTAISQESLRFVRLEDLGMWAPTVVRESPEAMDIFSTAFIASESIYKALGDLLITDEMPFAEKKIITSALRRIAPIGLGTNIGWTANLRTIRHVLEMRTHPSAEEEIRLVFAQVGKWVTEQYPNIFADYSVEEVDGIPWYTTPTPKV